MLADPACRLRDIAIVSDEERRRLTVEWNDTDRPLPEGDFVALFERWVAETPDAEAVAFGERTLTYAELDAQANRLAHYLQELGVGPEVAGRPVRRTFECFPIGMLGILKAGAAYLPVDPDYPAERIAWMLNDAMTPVIVSESRALDRLPSHWAQLVELDTEADTIASIPTPRRSATRDRPAGLRDLHLGLDRNAQGRRREPPRHRQPRHQPDRTLLGASGIAGAAVRFAQLRCRILGMLHGAAVRLVPRARPCGRAGAG